MYTNSKGEQIDPQTMLDSYLLNAFAKAKRNMPLHGVRTPEDQETQNNIDVLEAEVARRESLM